MALPLDGPCRGPLGVVPLHAIWRLLFDARSYSSIAHVAQIGDGHHILQVSVFVSAPDHLKKQRKDCSLRVARHGSKIFSGYCRSKHCCCDYNHRLASSKGKNDTLLFRLSTYMRICSLFLDTKRSIPEKQKSSSKLTFQCCFRNSRREKKNNGQTSLSRFQSSA